MISYWRDVMPVRQFLTDPRMPARVKDSHANCISRGLPEEFEVIGVDDGDPPQLVVRVTRDFVEATTDYRWQENGRARLTCPVCQHFDGKHAKNCAA